jgi:hypothetical protein
MGAAWDGSINGAPLNEGAIASDVATPIELPDSLGVIRLSGSADLAAVTILSVEGVSTLSFANTANPTVSPSSEGIASVAVVPELDMYFGFTDSGVATIKIFPSGTSEPSLILDGVSTIRLDVIGNPDVRDIAVQIQGLSTLAFSGQGELEASTSSAGVALLVFDGSGELEGSDTSEGLAHIQIVSEAEGDIWTYLYNEGESIINLSGLVSRLAIPRIPTAYSPSHPMRELKTLPDRPEMKTPYDGRDMQTNQEGRDMTVPSTRRQA